MLQQNQFRNTNMIRQKLLRLQHMSFLDITWKSLMKSSNLPGFQRTLNR